MCKKHIPQNTCNKPVFVTTAKSWPHRLPKRQASAALARLAKVAVDVARRSLNSRAARVWPWNGPGRIFGRRKSIRVAQSAQEATLPVAINLIATYTRAVWARGIIYW
jgi:hypothetical protein